jgi:CheY-like chemotaxis protein
MIRKRILIVDDEAAFARLLKLNLNRCGPYSAETVTDSTKALRAARDFHPDLILLDVMMPGLDGGEVHARLQAHPGLKKIPVVFLTAAVKRGEVTSHHGHIGGLDFLAKPVDLPELVDCIEQHLGKTPAGTVTA